MILIITLPYALIGVSEKISNHHILPEYYQPANIWAVYVTRLAMSACIRVTIEFLERYFQLHYSEQIEVKPETRTLSVS